MKPQSGFTLIEMVAVIIILAIMAATALPRFVNISAEARQSTVEGVAGGMRSAAALTKAKWLVNMAPYSTAVLNGTTTITVYDGTTAATSNLGGLPTPAAAGILAALEGSTIAGFSTVVDTATYNGYNVWPTGVANSTTCYANYQSGTVTVTASAAGCV